MKGSRLNGKGSSRLGSKRIIRANRGASKTEAETPEFMKGQKFSDEKIKELQKKLEAWKLKQKQ